MSATPHVHARQHCAGEALHTAVLGRLLRDAHAHTVGPPGHEVVLLEVWLQQQIEHHPKALPLFAALALPTEGDTVRTLEQARQRAAQLPAGRDVIVVGYGIETGNRANTPVLRVVRPLDIRPAAIDRQAESAAHPSPAQEAAHADA